MKTLFLTLAASIASGLALHYIARKALTTVIWLFDVTLTTDQRLLVHELGFPTFLLGLVVGGVKPLPISHKTALQKREALSKRQTYSYPSLRLESH